MEKQTVFLETFGDSPILKVLDFLVVNDDFDYSMTDIAQHSGVGYSTLKLFWSTLEQRKIVSCVRTVGRAKMYILNYDNPVVSKFKSFYWETTKQKIHDSVLIKK